MVLATRSRLAAAAGAAFALSTLGGYLLSVWIGLFGFKEVRTTAGIAAGLIEVAAFAALAVAAVTAGPVRQADEPASPVAVMLARVQAAAPMLIAAVGVVSVLALVLLGVAVAGAGGPPAAAAGAAGPGVTLKTTKIGGVTVLTNAKGLTLYWFAPDTATASKCTGWARSDSAPNAYRSPAPRRVLLGITSDQTASMALRHVLDYRRSPLSSRECTQSAPSSATSPPATDGR